MAELGLNQIDLAFSDGRAERLCLFALKNVNTGDTVNVSQYLSNVKLACVVGGTKGNVKGSVPASGVTVTIDSSGLAGDALWLVAWGSAP